MSKRLLAILVACVVSGTAWATVTTVSEGIRHDALFGLCMEGEQGIAVGEAGVVLQSEDGGNSRLLRNRPCWMLTAGPAPSSLSARKA